MTCGVDRPAGGGVPAGPGPLVAIPGYLIRRSQAVHNALWGELVPGELTGPQYAVLSVLAAFPGADIHRVAQLASLDKSSAADVVARLVRKAWVDRKRNPDDARRYLLSLTQAAAIALSSITPHASAVQDALLAPLQAARRADFVNELTGIARLTADELDTTHQVAYPVLELAVPGHLIRRAQQVHTAYWAEIMGGRLTGPQYAALHVIGRWPEINLRRLGDLAALDSSSTTDIVNRLVGKAWVTRTKDAADGRGKVLSLTPLGVAELEDVHPKVELVQQRLLEPLCPPERRRFVRDLSRVAFEGDPPAAVV